MKRGGNLARYTPLESRTPMPSRTSPIPRSAALERPWPLLSPGMAGNREAGKIAATRKPIKPVSTKRAAENRERAAMADRLWPDRREGTVMCGCGRPECNRRADDLHEPLTRARGGGIADDANAIPLARECHDEITLGPDWAYAAGLLVHSWDAAGGAA